MYTVHIKTCKIPLCQTNRIIEFVSLKVTNKFLKQNILSMDKFSNKVIHENHVMYIKYCMSWTKIRLLHLEFLN